VTRSRAAWAAILAVAMTLLLAIVGQVDPDPGMSHVNLTVSDFAVADRGGATDWSMLTFALAGLLLLGSLRPVGSTRTYVARVALVVFSGGMVTAAVAPTDPGLTLTATGYVHRWASIVAFVALPIAGLGLIRVLPPAVRRVTRWLVLIAVVFMVAMAVSSSFLGRDGIGVIERVLLGDEAVLLAALAFGSWRTGGSVRDVITIMVQRLSHFRSISARHGSAD
jgi:hypothetical protein